jgi:hypothetical protein
MDLEHLVNLCFDKKFNNEHKPVLWRPFTEAHVYEAFKQFGTGLYVPAVVSVNNNIVSKAISLLTGKYSHIVLVWYTENLRADVRDDEWARLLEKYKFFYGDLPDIEEKLASTKMLVLGSMDDTGSNYHSYSKYMYRNQVIFKPKVTPIQQKEILHYMLQEDVMNVIYDYTGLVFQLLKLFDDEKAWYCSEQVYDVLIKWHCKTARKKDPSPTDQVRYWRYWAEKIILQNIEKL